MTPSPTDSGEDALLGGRVRLRQPDSGYRAAIDPVLLAAAVNPPSGAAVLDIGCGSGAALLCLAARRPDLFLTGLEKFPAAAALAQENVALNGAQQRAQVVEGCLLAPPPAVAERRFAAVMMNPPYLAAGAATPPPDPWKAAANVEGAAKLADWAACAHARLIPRGILTLVHRADRLADILAALGGRFGGVVLFPLWPRPGEPAKRILLSAVRDSRQPLRLAAGLVLHDAAGGYTDVAQAVLNGATLRL